MVSSNCIFYLFPTLFFKINQNLKGRKSNMAANKPRLQRKTKIAVKNPSHCSQKSKPLHPKIQVIAAKNPSHCGQKSKIAAKNPKWQSKIQDGCQKSKTAAENPSHCSQKSKKAPKNPRKSSQKSKMAAKNPSHCSQNRRMQRKVQGGGHFQHLHLLPKQQHIQIIFCDLISGSCTNCRTIGMR